MTEHRRFNIHTLDELRQEIARLGADIPLDRDVSILNTPLEIAGHRLPNRLTVQPMEGFDADPQGTPGELSFRRYRRYAAGGAALIWFEATAVVSEGRSNPGQFWLHDANVEVFKRLVDATREAARDAFGWEPMLIVQLTHSGRYSKPAGVPQPLIAHHSPMLDPRHGLDQNSPLVTDEYLDQLQAQFAKTAKLAAQAGFDGIDVKSCHRYLVAELHASFTREGRYGGSFENRTRFIRETLQQIRKATPGTLVTTRLNAYDAMSYPYGFGVSQDDCRGPDLTEPLKLVGELREIGIPLLNISIGNPYFNPHFGRPFDFPVAGFEPPEESPLLGINRFLKITRTIQETYPELPVIGSGYAWLRQFMPNVAAAVLRKGWASLIGQGRGSFAFPESPKEIFATGRMDPERCCVTCSGCTQIMRDGGKTGCVVRDSEIYGPQFRLGRRFSLDRLQQEAERCRDCDHATCTSGCSARIDIPRFIKAFAAGDLKTAYDVLRANNILPEMCGSVCPSGEQCEGHCIENIFCENPIPIQDIQLVVARTARLQGLTGVRLPETESGCRAAVVGGGPTGLACAIKLLEAGHSVTLFEAGDTLGGVPDTTIPRERFADSEAEVQAILAPALAAGRLCLKFGTPLGADLNLELLQKRFDAVFIGVGLGDATSLDDGPGTERALRFLATVKRGARDDVPAGVAVIGGGNTAMDAALTAKELGAEDVYLIYRRSFGELPAWEQERNACLNAGVNFLILTQPVGFARDAAGVLTGIEVVRTKLGPLDASGRRRPEAIRGSESVIPVQLVIEALGQQMNPEIQPALDGLKLTAKGLIETTPFSQATNLPGVYAGGDIVNGGTTAVQGIAEGMKAAGEMDAYLSSTRDG